MSSVESLRNHLEDREEFFSMCGTHQRIVSEFEKITFLSSSGLVVAFVP